MRALDLRSDVLAPVPETTPEQNLFLSVIAIAVNDFRGDFCAVSNARMNGMVALQKRAEAWLFSPLYEDDFIAVCRLANVEPDFVRDVARRAKKEPVVDPLVARRARLKKILPATTAEVMERMKYAASRGGESSLTMNRDMRAIGAVKQDGEWRLP